MTGIIPSNGFRTAAIAVATSVAMVASANLAHATQLSTSDCTLLRGATVEIFNAPQLKGRLSPEFAGPWLNYIRSGCVGPVEIPTPQGADIDALASIAALAGRNGINFGQAGIRAVANGATATPAAYTPGQ